MGKQIGIIVNSYRASVGLEAGGNIHFIEVAKRWHDVDIVLFAPAEGREDLLAALPSARFVAIPDLKTPHWRLDQIPRLLGGIALRKQLRAMDAILCTSHFVADVLPAVIARPSRTVVTLHHMLEPPWRRHGSLGGNLVAWLSQGASLLVAKLFVRRFVFNCQYVMETSRWATSGAACYLGTNGVSGSDEQATNVSARRDGIYLGRLDPMKRVEDAIRAWSLLPEICADQRLHIAGSGPRAYRQKLEDLVLELGLGGRVIFHGRVDNETKWNLLRRAALYVFPSSEEGWGISVAEAMWAGLPCVTYDLPVFRGLFSQGRRSVALGDVDALAKECATLLTDENERVCLAGEALELSRSFAWERAAEVEFCALTF